MRTKLAVKLRRWTYWSMNWWFYRVRLDGALEGRIDDWLLHHDLWR